MRFPNWTVEPKAIFLASPVIPVLVIKNLDEAIPLATALLAGGISILEITLRSPIALDAVSLLINTFPEALIGVGTITNSQQLQQAEQAGAKFALSPGLTQDLLDAGQDSKIAFIPGVASVSELMIGLNAGYQYFKLFPAMAIGGIALLRAIQGPFPQAQFCPTGGINEKNYTDFLALPNVSCVGGSWIVPDEAIKQQNWPLITKLAKTVFDYTNEII